MMMMLGYYPLKRFDEHYYYGITSDQLQYKKENKNTQYQQKQAHQDPNGIFNGL